MSTEAAPLPGLRSALRDPRHVAIFRFAGGVTLAVGLALGFAWPLGFLTPVLVAKLLGTPGFRPSWRVGLGMLAGITGGFGLGLAIALFLTPYPLLALLGVGFALFRVFHASAGGASPFGVTMLLLGLTLLPLVVMESPALAVDFAGGFLLLGALAMALVGLAHGLWPDPATPGSEGASQAPPPLDPREQLRQALISTAVVLPLLVVFFTLKLTGSVLVLAFVAILAQQPGLRAGLRSGAALLVGNLLGGLAAILCYELLVAVPLFGFLLVLTLLAALLFGERILGGDPRAALAGMAFSTFLILLGSSTAPTGDDADAGFYGRIFQVFLAALYVVGAFGLLELAAGGRRPRPAGGA
jgi:hypothetical protein